MAEAVIVAAARTPIGRAAKGSLVSVRPDDLAAGVISAALDRLDGFDPATLDDIYLAAPSRATSMAGTWPEGGCPAGSGQRARGDGEPVLRLERADRKDGVSRDQGR